MPANMRLATPHSDAGEKYREKHSGKGRTRHTGAGSARRVECPQARDLETGSAFLKKSGARREGTPVSENIGERSAIIRQTDWKF